MSLVMVDRVLLSILLLVCKEGSFDCRGCDYELECEKTRCRIWGE